MPYQFNFQEVTIDGDTEVVLSGTKDVRIASAINTPRLIGISNPAADVLIAVQNFTTVQLPLVHVSGAVSEANRKLILNGGGDWSLPPGKVVRALSVDPNDAGFADANRGWYVDNAARWSIDASVHAAGSFTAKTWTVHLVDLSGAAVTANLPAASAANEGGEILIVQSVAGVGTLNLTPASISIEGAATLALTGAASAPFLTARLVSCGVGAGSPGWKVIHVSL